MTERTSPQPGPRFRMPRRVPTGSRRLRARTVLPAAGASLALLVSLTPSVQAETPSPEPSLTSPAASPTTTTAPPDPQGSDEPSPSPSPTPTVPALSLAVTPSGGPVSAFYEDLGRFAFAGTATALDEGTPVRIARRTTAGWTTVAQATVAAGSYSASLPVQAAGEVTFRATAAAQESPDVVSEEVPVTVRDATVTLDRPAATVDSLKSLRVTGRVDPARAGVSVHVDVRSGSRWKQVAATPTDAAGTFSTTISHGKGSLTSYTLRATYRAANRERWEASGQQRFTRIAVLDASVSATTAAEVAKTYRRGCPVGPSRLRTVRLNFYGRDKKMHRGVIIIRTDLTQEIIRGFGSALKHRYPVAKMNNPNVYGGNDPKQMAANNTSGFNCRKVVGNPYAQSPHSYGIALDVNTVQNPYRDSRGRWWPSNGTSYIDRTPLRWGMLGTGSHLTRSLRRDHFFWGGLWNPGRDYQHFEYRR